jgi:hypothetical protein
MVYELGERKIIISQATPAFRREHMNRSLLVSALFRQEGQMRRWGFNVRLTEFTKNYEIASKERVMAFAGAITSSLAPVDFRECYRVTPLSVSDLYFLLDDNKEERPIINISLGGILFSQPRTGRICKPREEIPLLIVIDDLPLKTHAQVIRIEEREINSLIACKFIGENRELQTLLGKKVFDIQRQQLSKGRL